jgi:serpin B
VDDPSPARPVHALAAGLWRQLAGGPGNLAVSPYSVAMALGMTATGASGRTLDEMLALLDVPDVDSLTSAMAELTRHLESQGEVELRSASRLFGERTTPWEPDFLAALERGYAAGLGSVDFATATEEARTAINSWTEERTRGRITDLVPPGVLSGLSQLVLVNALYLKAAWADQFQPGRTAAGAFTLGDGSTVDVPMMRAASPSELGTGAGWRATRLPYDGHGLAMTVVLPGPGRLAEVEDAVAAGGLPDILGSLHRQRVDLTLPRWTFRTAAQLQDALARLGMPTAFGPDADFSGMTKVDELFISAVLHQVFVAVDEDGTEAAAATAVAMRGTGLPETPVPMVVDRPFLFVIHDVLHGTPLFLGRVADPRAA